MHNVRIAVVGLLAFKLLGGRFWAISPSSYTHVGSFARRSIPAKALYATPTQKHALNRIGRLGGCHTCGRRAPKSFIGDHMPPKAVAQEWNARWYNQLLNRRARFRFYPQCQSCSSRQGGILSKAVARSQKNLAKAGGGKLAHFHGWRPRWNHFAGGVVAGTTVVGATNPQIQQGNPIRYRNLQDRVEELGSRVHRAVFGPRQARW